jgi:HEPN domain-containing protein
MKPLTAEWVEKAEGDARTARREFRARKEPDFDAACFHAQQLAVVRMSGKRFAQAWR